MAVAKGRSGGARARPKGGEVVAGPGPESTTVPSVHPGLAAPPKGVDSHATSGGPGPKRRHGFSLGGQAVRALLLGPEASPEQAGGAVGGGAIGRSAGRPVGRSAGGWSRGSAASGETLAMPAHNSVGLASFQLHRERLHRARLPCTLVHERRRLQRPRLCRDRRSRAMQHDQADCRHVA